jgi:hypothetical protein
MANHMIKFRLFCIYLIPVVLALQALAINAEQITFVSPSGETNISREFKKYRLDVKISTHEVEIGKPSDGLPEIRNNSCTYSRYPCSLVDRIDIRINKTPIFVPRSVYSDLADINKAKLVAGTNSYILILHGGDASESYKAVINFNRERIISREVWSGEAGKKTQETKYFRVVLGD